MNKQEVITALKDSRQKFLQAIQGMSEEDLLKPGAAGEWSIKDLLAHLNMWEAELIRLLWQVQQGVKPTTVHFEKKGVDELNLQWQKDNHERPLDMIMNDFRGIRGQTIRRVEAFHETDLTNPKRYPWLKEKPLWEWIANDSFAHESEHLEQLTQGGETS